MFVNNKAGLLLKQIKSIIPNTFRRMQICTRKDEKGEPY